MAHRARGRHATSEISFNGLIFAPLIRRCMNDTGKAQNPRKTRRLLLWQLLPVVSKLTAVDEHRSDCKRRSIRRHCGKE